MNLRFLPVLALALLMGRAHAVSTFAVANGDWNSASSWNPAAVPTSSDVAVIQSGDTAVVDGADVAQYFALGSGGTAGTLLIQTGGSLTTSANAYVGRSAVVGYTATLTMTGGSLSVPGLFVGDATAPASPTATSTATMTVSGGTFTGTLAIGGPSGQTYGAGLPDQTGLFKIVGSSALISGGVASRALTVNTYGTLEFDLGASGVSALNYSLTGDTVTFASGSALVVDGTNYTGGSQTIQLIQYGTLTGSVTGTSPASTVSLLNFNGYTASLSLDAGGHAIDLNIVAVPEPTAGAFLLLGAAMAGLSARRRQAAGARVPVLE